MKIKCTIKMDLEDTDYEMGFEILEGRQDDIDYHQVKAFLLKVLDDWAEQMETGIDSDENVMKEIH